ncbi:alpha/beta fold hydrolase [Ramlibacter algicola]|uniref:Alpha/beta fold hydrolase n=1 Tax=Ramlibacter algicola TaxID=2795217 RepID=A0A934Q0E4_9BURK|nr:alpha/beta fold hydrolase [Ramlibacter algicola]MBK0392181.1 alpha/beta fold hydrolase [Ramlibacter algicola]
MTTHVPALPPVALTFDAAGDWCFGWYHPPALPWRDMAIVLCPPMGHEAVCSYPTQVQLATTLAEAGFPVFRFDYHGTGDSSGDGMDAARVNAWVDSTVAAIEQARRHSQAQSVALLGIRLGATFALEAAAREGGVDSLLLWAPCASGKAFVREMRAAGVQDDEGMLHAMGERYTAPTLVELQALDPAKAATTAPARRALVIGRDDLSAEGPLPKSLRALGMDVDYRVLPGYAAMVDEPRAGVLDAATLREIENWFASSPAARVRADVVAPPVEDPCWRQSGPVRESLVRCGAGGSLVGVVTEPAEGRANDRAGQTGLLLLNVGGNYRVGPHRVYVGLARTLAAAGHAVLRLDIAGIGDSPAASGQKAGTLYERASAQDVRAAIDALAQRGCREFVLLGICSGSYLAFQTALVDERADGVVLMNSRLLEWTPGKPGDTWQSSMQQYAKSSDYYRRALFTAEAWRKLLRGQVDVRLIATRMLSLATARLARALSFGGHEESLLRKMRRLCARGTDVLMLVSEADDGRDYVEFHFGPSGRRMRAHPNFRMAYVPDADHTFSRPGNREHVARELLRHLAQRPLPARRHPATPEPPASVLEEATPSTPL